jgi:hypothetical protein
VFNEILTTVSLTDEPGNLVLTRVAPIVFGVALETLERRLFS